MNFDGFERKLSEWMHNHGIFYLRISIGIIFIWFGALKFFNLSPAGSLVAKTITFIPAEVFLPILALWEVLIGICFLYRPFLRFALLLLFPQMVGTFLPLVLLPEITFTHFPYAFTLEGQYIVKNLVIISAAFVIGGTIRQREHKGEIF